MLFWYEMDYSYECHSYKSLVRMTFIRKVHLISKWHRYYAECHYESVILLSGIVIRFILISFILMRVILGSVILQSIISIAQRHSVFAILNNAILLNVIKSVSVCLLTFCLASFWKMSFCWMSFGLEWFY